jgi:anti-sigma B factor antagonist
MEVSVEQKGTVAVVKVSGVVDLGKSPALRERMLALVREGVKGLVIDMSGVKYLDSSGMATLVDMLNRIEDKGGNMVVTGLPKEMRQMFRITHLDQRFDFAEDAGIAIEKIKKTTGNDQGVRK